MGDSGLFGKEVTCFAWSEQSSEKLHKTWRLSAYWGIRNSTRTDLVTAAEAVLQWNLAINKPTSPLHIVGAWHRSHTKLLMGKTEKSESFLSQRSFPWGGFGDKKQKKKKKIRTKCSRWRELKLMQKNIYLQVKICNLGFILYISFRVKQRTNGWCGFSSPQNIRGN